MPRMQMTLFSAERFQRREAAAPHPIFAIACDIFAFAPLPIYSSSSLTIILPR